MTRRARSIAHRGRAASRDDNATAWALYFRGRVHQEAGRLDEAIIAFEERLVEERETQWNDILAAEEEADPNGA